MKKATGTTVSPTKLARFVTRISLDEQQKFARKYRETGDIHWRDQLVFSCLAWVFREASKYARIVNNPQLHDDLVSEGVSGLLKAMEHFDPNRAVPLLSYARHWVKREMLEFISTQLHIVHVTRTGRSKGAVVETTPLQGSIVDEKAQEFVETVMRAEGLQRVLNMVRETFGDRVTNQFERYYLSLEEISLRKLGEEEGVSGEMIRQRLEAVLRTPKIRSALLCVLR